MSSTTRYIDLSRLKNSADSPVIIMCMSLVTDLQLALYLQRLLKGVEGKDSKELVSGGRFYLFRILFAHAREGLRVIDLIRKSESLMNLVKNDSAALSAFQELPQFGKNSPHKKDYEFLDEIRNMGTFHYYDYQDASLPIWISEALDTLVKRGDVLGSIVEAPHENLPIRFALADNVIDVYFFEKIFHRDPTLPLEQSFDVRNKQLSKLVDNIMNVCIAILRGAIDDFQH